MGIACIGYIMLVQVHCYVCGGLWWYNSSGMHGIVQIALTAWLAPEYDELVFWHREPESTQADGGKAW